MLHIDWGLVIQCKNIVLVVGKSIQSELSCLKLKAKVINYCHLRAAPCSLQNKSGLAPEPDPEHDGEFRNTHRKTSVPMQLQIVNRVK